jgi:hypothetical protein
MVCHANMKNYCQLEPTPNVDSSIIIKKRLILRLMKNLEVVGCLYRPSCLVLEVISLNQNVSSLTCIVPHNDQQKKLSIVIDLIHLCSMHIVEAIIANTGHILVSVTLFLDKRYPRALLTVLRSQFQPSTPTPFKIKIITKYSYRALF